MTTVLVSVAQIVVLLVVTVLLTLLLYQAAMAVEKPLFKFLDSRWLADDAEVILDKGNRLISVLIGDKMAHVWWAVFDTWRSAFGLAVFAVLIVRFFEGIVPAVLSLMYGMQIPYWQTAVGSTLLLVLLTSVYYLFAVPFTYWVTEWKRTRTKFVITIRVVYIYAPQISWFALIFPQADSNYSDNASTRLVEVLVRVDPENLGGKKTGWLQEKWLKYLNRKYGLAAILFPTDYRGPRGITAADLLSGFRNAIRIVNILHKVAEMATELKEVAGGLVKAKVAILSPNVDKPEQTHTSVRKNMRAFEQKARTLKLLANVDLIDLSTVTDPGVCDYELGSIREDITVANSVLGTQDSIVAVSTEEDADVI